MFTQCQAGLRSSSSSLSSLQKNIIRYVITHFTRKINWFFMRKVIKKNFSKADTFGRFIQMQFIHSILTFLFCVFFSYVPYYYSKNALYLSIGRKNTSSGKENKQVSPSSSDEGSSLQFIFGSHYSGESTPAVSTNMTSTGHVACKFPIRSHNVYSDRSIHNAGVAKPLDETVRTLFGHKDLRTISVEGLMSGSYAGMSKTSLSSFEQNYDSVHMNSPFRTYSPV